MGKIDKIDIETLFCTICWRPRSVVKKSSKFCSVHAHINNSCEYKRRRRRLNQIAIAKNLGEKTDQVVRKLCTTIRSPEWLNSKLQQSTGNIYEWKHVVEELLSLSVEHYKFTVENIQTLELTRFKNISEWICAVIRKLGQELPNETCEDFMMLSEGKSISELAHYLFHLLARFEVETQYQLNVQVRRGPKPASIDFNVPVYRDLLQAHDERKKPQDKVWISELARKHKISRQAMYEKWKRVATNPEHYRKAINKTKNKKIENKQLI